MQFRTKLAAGALVAPAKMGKKRSHQVTRSIIKSFPKEAEKVFDDKHVVSEGEEVSASEHEEISLGEEEDDECGELESMSESEEEEEDFSEADDFDEELEAVEEEEEEDDIIPKKQRPVKKETDLGSAISQILNQNVKTEDAAPILAKRRNIEKKIADEKLEAKARSLMKRQRLATKDAARVVQLDFTRANFEKGLRKAATKGVVQLFNAIHQHQVTKEKLAKEKAAASGKQRPNAEAVQEIKQISKTSFLDMLKGGASAQIKK